MDLLQAIFREGDVREQYEEFSRRYYEGHPANGYSDAEVLARYHEISELLSPALYCDVAERALDRLDPQERRQFRGVLMVRLRRDLARIPSVQRASRPQVRSGEPADLARLMAELQRRRPGALGSAVTAEVQRTSRLDPPTKAALAGIVAFGVRYFLSP
jgi:hypothetical protein